MEMTIAPKSDHVEEILDRIRGNQPAQPSHARDVAADLDHPGCHLRAVLDAAAMDKAALAARLGHPMPEEQSPAALRRGNLFERIVVDDGHLLAEARNKLGLDIEDARYKDLSDVPEGLRGRAAMRWRAQRTTDALVEMLTNPDAAYNILRHPVTTLSRGGRTSYLEQDALAFVSEGRLYVVEVKSFSVIPGVPTDRSHVAQAARQSAVYVLSLQQTLERLGLDPGLVSTTTLLITAKGYGLTPTSHTLDVRNELKALRRRLARRTNLSAVLAQLPDDLTFDVDDPDELADQVTKVDNYYTPGCLSSCSMARVCRERCIAGDRLDRLGQGVRADLGAFDTVTDVVTAARTGQVPSGINGEVASFAADVTAALHTAHTAYLANGGAA
ncbi:hypothetical protein ACI8AF_21725 [Blastococcus sp. SYSU D00669]